MGRGNGNDITTVTESANSPRLVIPRNIQILFSLKVNVFPRYENNYEKYGKRYFHKGVGMEWKKGLLKYILEKLNQEKYLKKNS